jgi:hypothetical protein
MAFKISYEATSDKPCVVNVLGEFEPGVTRQFDASVDEEFQAVHGHKLAASNFAPWFHLTTIIANEAEEV